MSILDYIKTKKEKAQESRDYFNKIFPHGEVQRDTVKEVIKQLFPDHTDFNLFFTYVVIKEFNLNEDWDEERISSRTDKEIKKVGPKLNDNQKLLLMLLLSVDTQVERLISSDEYLEIINDSFNKIKNNL